MHSTIMNFIHLFAVRIILTCFVLFGPLPVGVPITVRLVGAILLDGVDCSSLHETYLFDKTMTCNSATYQVGDKIVDMVISGMMLIAVYMSGHLAAIPWAGIIVLCASLLWRGYAVYRLRANATDDTLAHERYQLMWFVNLFPELLAFFVLWQEFPMIHSVIPGGILGGFLGVFAGKCVQEYVLHYPRGKIDSYS